MVAIKPYYSKDNFVVDGYRLKKLLGSGVLWLDKNKEKVNRLNVFPVPDGDTGTNMYLTMRHAYQKVEQISENHVGKVSAALAEGAVIGSRGNSGVILSQIWAGVAEALDGQPVLNAELLAEACRIANEKAYKAVQDPVEGTILTVCRHMTNTVIDNYEDVPDLVALLKKMLFAGRASLRRTPDLLPKLKEAGVVDSGGAGLVLIFEGMLFPLVGKDIADEVEAPTQPQSWEESLEPEDELGYGYDVQFLMRGDNLDIDSVRTAIQNMGWSTLVVGTNSVIKVHVHVHNPGEPLSYAIGIGASLEDIVVENMQEQYHTYVENRKANDTGAEAHIEDDEALDLPAPDVGVITVASGRGLSRLFRRELGAAHVITGGQTMNPSTGDFLDAIAKVPSKDIILLPNNKNILLAAQAAAQQTTDKNVRVVPSHTIPQGISAMIEYANICSGGMTCELNEAVEAMNEALALVVTAEVTKAIRDTVSSGIAVREGQWIGLLDDVLVAADDDMHELICELLLKGGADDRERATFYYGEDVSPETARALTGDLAQEFDRLEFEVVAGDQTLYPYIISIE
jgi:DAK2 domain fusion protein YloV